MKFNDIRRKLYVTYYRHLEKFLEPLAQKGVTPNTVTIISLCISLFSAICYAFGYIFMGGLLLLLSGFTDTMDGTIARLTGQTTKFGALLDSSLDRFAEFFVFFGLIVYFHTIWMLFVVMGALMGSIMVSYVKARAESLGAVKVVGLMQRPERIVLLSAGSFLNAPIGQHLPECRDCTLIITLLLLALLTHVTVLHRLMVGKKDLTQPE